MPVEITMPQLGESVVEGTISRWLKQPGEHVAEYEALLEITTDKVDTEVPAPTSGVLREIKVAEGETVRVGTLLAILDTNQGATKRDERHGQPSGEIIPPDGEVVEHTSSQNSSTAPSPPISPVVAKLATEYNLDLSQITGTGQGGRVSKQDVLKYLDQRSQGSQQPAKPQEAREITVTPPAAITSEPALQETVLSGPQTSAPAIPIVEPSVTFPAPSPSASEADAEIIPISTMRRAIAEHMTRSLSIAAHVTTVTEVDVSKIVAHRERHKDDFELQGVKLTFTPYFVQAVVAALRAVPILNSTYTDQGIIVYRRHHIGVAVALNEGLIVPVVRDAGEKNLLGLARAVNDLSTHARARRLKPDEAQGGTFTITNHGIGGSLFATPIIHQPQSGILGIGAIQKRPVVITQGDVDAIAIRPMCYLSLSFDHRVVDGATADQFMMVVKRFLEGYNQA